MANNIMDLVQWEHPQILAEIGVGYGKEDCGVRNRQNL